MRQRFERTGFEQVMDVLSVGAFDGKGVFLPVVNGGFSVVGFADQVAALVVTVVYACILFKQVAPRLCSGMFFLGCLLGQPNLVCCSLDQDGYLRGQRQRFR